ncbi:MAG: methylmalonyl-CoA mutase subunit beta [Flavobacteriaceae bacterium]
MGAYLFDEFDTLTPAAWKQKIQVDLKGADYNDSLLWKTNEGIIVKPFYTKEDRSNTQISLPIKGYKICQSIFVDDVTIANKLALNALSRGANAIQFVADKSFDYKGLLQNINLESTAIYFKLNFLNADFMIEFSGFYPENNFYFQSDIIGNLATTGNWFVNLTDDVKQTQNIVNNVSNSICVNASIYQNAGATMVQELGYALAHTNEYIELFGSNVAKQIHYSFSVGNNYFFEIAKLRAFRILHKSLLQEHGIEGHSIHLFSNPSLRNKTIYDYNVNMLRTTSECMSAIIGGSNTISNISYDRLYHKSNEFGERISRNQLLILQKEAYLQEAQTYADGAYYIESITDQLAEKALTIFKQIEKGGGFLKQLKSGIIQKKIHESAQKEQDQFNTKQITLLGTNKLPNKEDKMKDNLQIYPFLKQNNSKTLIPPILQKRLSEQHEKHRLETELL